jgi:flagellar biosynthesis protein FliQ
VSFGDVVQIGQQAILVALIAAAPVLLLSLLVGLVISLFQAVTQIQEPTLAFIPRSWSRRLQFSFSRRSFSRS